MYSYHTRRRKIRKPVQIFPKLVLIDNRNIERGVEIIKVDFLPCILFIFIFIFYCYGKPQKPLPESHTNNPTMKPLSVYYPAWLADYPKTSSPISCGATSISQC